MQLLTIEDVIFADSLPAMDVPDVKPYALKRLIESMVMPDGDTRPQLDTVHTRLLNLKFGTPEHAWGGTNGSKRYLKAPLCFIWPVHDHHEVQHGHVTGSNEDSNQSLDSDEHDIQSLEHSDFSSSRDIDEDTRQSSDDDGSRVQPDGLDPVPVQDVVVGDPDNGVYGNLLLCLQCARPLIASGGIDAFYVGMSRPDDRFHWRDNASQYMFVTRQEPHQVRLHLVCRWDEYQFCIYAFWKSTSSSGFSTETCVSPISCVFTKE